MMSFGGGWFFVAQSAAISVMNKDIKLPGLGSFMASAADLDADRSHRRVSSEGGTVRPAAGANRGVLSGEHDLSVRGRLLRRAS